MTDIIVFLMCALAGFLVGNYLKKQSIHKNFFYLDSIKYIKLLLTNIDTKQVVLNDFNADYCISCCKDFNEFISLGKMPSYLLKTEKKLFNDLQYSLTNTIRDKMIINLNFLLEQINGQYEEFVSSKFTQAKVYEKIGLLCGAMIGILLI